jgi:molybdopterin-binding protein
MFLHPASARHLVSVSMPHNMRRTAEVSMDTCCTTIKAGAVMAEVTVRVDPGDLTAAITDTSRDRLKVKAGDEVTVVIKATDVMIAKA